MRILFTLCISIISIISTTLSAAAAGVGHYKIPDDARVTVGDSIYWDYAHRPFDSLRTEQYAAAYGGHIYKRFFKVPAIHAYHGAGNVTQSALFALPSTAYVNLPAEIRAAIPYSDTIDIFFLVTLVQAWDEEDGKDRPLSLRPHHWNDPDVPYNRGGYDRKFANEIGIFNPTPPELRLNGTVNILYQSEAHIHEGDNPAGGKMLISSPDSDHLMGGYTYKRSDTPNLNLCFWGVVKGPTPRGPKTAIVLNWVTSDDSALRSLTDGALIKEWILHATSLGLDPTCANQLKMLLGLTEHASSAVRSTSRGRPHSPSRYSGTVTSAGASAVRSASRSRSPIRPSSRELAVK